MLEHHSTSTARTPSRLPTPPPLALDLRHAGRPVGWVRGDAIGFRGFGSNGEATHAAWVAYRALAQRLAKAGGRRPIPVDVERLTLSRRGDGDVVMASGQPIATLLRPGPTSRSGDSFGFEIRIPAPTYESRMRAMAYLAYRTMRKSGVRWALWARDGRPEASGGDANSTERTTPPRAPRTEARGATHGALESSRRWWARRVRAAESTTRGRARRRARSVTITATASVVALLLAFVVPDHVAAPLGVLGLSGLFVGRLLAPHTGVRDPSERMTDRSLTKRVARDEPAMG